MMLKKNSRSFVESALVAFTILIFCLSAIDITVHSLEHEAAHGHIEEHADSEGKIFHDFYHHAFFTDVILFINQSERYSADKILRDIEEYYVRIQSYIPLIIYDAKGRQIHNEFETKFLSLKNILLNFEGVKDEDWQSLAFSEYVAFKNTIPPYADFLHEQLEEEHKKNILADQRSNLFATITMIISGLGLILLLLAKLNELKRASSLKERVLFDLKWQKSETDRHLAAIEAAGEGIVIVDANGNLSYMNRSLKEMHGIDDSEESDYIGAPWYMIYGQRGQKDAVENVIPIVEKEGFWEAEKHVKTKSGKVFFAALSLTKLPDGGMIGTSRDISERYQAQLEKEDIQKQFYRSQKMEALGRLAGGIAHDFNNILASMVGYSEFLLEDLKSGSKQHDFAKQILKGGHQAQGLIEQILAFSKHNDSERRRLNLLEVIEDNVSILRSTVSSEINVETSIETDDAYVDASQAQMNQTFMNLFVNAIDAMEKGTLSISLNKLSPKDVIHKNILKRANKNAEGEEIGFINEKPDGTLILEWGDVDQEKDYVCVTVKDTGSGMQREVLEHIFEPFFSTKGLEKGTGLGMSTAHGIIMAHEGAIAIETKYNKGSAFYIYLPYAMSREAEIRDKTDERIGELKNLNILLVEDNKAVQKMLSQLMKRNGMKTYICSNGADAIDHLREKPNHYDLIVTDYAMPNMNGAEMAAEIACDFPSLPIILISGYSAEKYEDIIAHNDNIKAALKKPINKNMLLDAIEKALGKTAS